MMTPGQYLRKRREASGRSIEDLTLALETVPAVSAAARAEWLRQIESDLVPVPDTLAAAIAETGLMRFDADMLDRLADHYTRRDTWNDLSVCRACGCSEWDACEPACHWVEPDLCSGCVRPALPDNALGARPAIVLGVDLARAAA
jgi:hypothetical protein